MSLAKEDILASNAFIEVFKNPINETEGPLDQLTFAVKDNIPICGKALSFGTKPFYSTEVDSSAEIINKLFSLGAKCIGRTNLDEYALNYSGKNPHYGEMINPSFLGRSVLGSSGGSAAAVAMGACDFALGTDLGGSIRTPAAATGTYGLKFSAGSYYCQNSLLLSKDIDSYGILSKSLKTLETVTEAIFDSRDTQINKLKYLDLDSLGNITQEFKDLYSKTISSIGSKLSLEAIDKPSVFKEAHEPWKTLAIYDLVNSLKKFGISEDSDVEVVKASYSQAKLIADEDISTALLSKNDIANSLGTNFFIITPVLSGPSPLLKEKNSENIDYNNPGYFMSLANLLGLPSLSIPVDGQFSIQIVGGKNQEVSLVSIAKEIMGV